MNKTTFFNAVRPMFPGKRLTAVQVQVIEAILDQGRALSAAHLACILATGFGEAKLTPTRENMNYSAKRIRQVWPSRPEAVQFAGKPRALANSVYGGRLGNKVGSDDGWNMRGGGIDQLTGRDNYRKVGIENNPERILQPDFAVKSIMHGMTTGRYTGRKLADYGDGATFNATAARAIVNGDVKLNGAKYAGYHAKFLAALRNAGWGTAPPVRPDVEPAPAKPQQGWLARLLAAIFGKGA